MPHQATVPSLALFLIASVITSACQDRDPKWSKFTLGGQFSTLSMEDGWGSRADVGFGANFEFHFSPRLSLDSEFDFWPQDHRQAAQDGGNTLAIYSGLKANFIQHRKFAIYGEMQPGIMSFSNVPVHVGALEFENPQNPLHSQPRRRSRILRFPTNRRSFLSIKSLDRDSFQNYA